MNNIKIPLYKDRDKQGNLVEAQVLEALNECVGSYSDTKIKFGSIFFDTRKNVLSINKVFIDDEFRFLNLAHILMLAIVEFCKVNNLKIIANCSFSQAFFEKNDELRVELCDGI